MTQEEKEILIKDLCTRQPYGVKVYCEWNYYQGERAKISGTLYGIDLHHSKEILFQRESGKTNLYTRVPFNEIDGTVLPYLRPMSSMTEEEKKDLYAMEDKMSFSKNCSYSPDRFDWYIRHHFDFRGLIEKGLALEAPEGMYNF